jgi:hypothetical protein
LNRPTLWQPQLTRYSRATDPLRNPYAPGGFRVSEVRAFQVDHGWVLAQRAEQLPEADAGAGRLLFETMFR